jgi:hypothetical protein
MKIIYALVTGIFLLSLNPACTTTKASGGGCYKGQLVIKGLCMNYTIKLLEGNIDTSLIAAQWKDDHTDKMYSNVFALGSKCNFPPGIKEGDSFYFTIDNSTVQNCVVCLAYYPVPSKQLSIKVLESCR